MSFIEKGYIEMGCLRDDVFTIWLSRYDRLGFGNNEFKPIFNRYIGIKDKDEYNNVLATLDDTPTSQALLEKLPMVLTMKELNGNEKFYNLEYSLPVTSQSVNQINKGDLMLFHDNCLVLFYQDFLSKYQYTRIGQIDDAGNINQIVGAGDLVVSFMKYRNGEENGNN